MGRKLAGVIGMHALQYAAICWVLRTPQQKITDCWRRLNLDRWGVTVVWKSTVQVDAGRQVELLAACIELSDIGRPFLVRRGRAEARCRALGTCASLVPGTCQERFFARINARSLISTERLNGDQWKEFDRAEDGYESYKDAMASGLVALR